MHKISISIILSILLGQVCLSQNDSLIVEYINKTEINYKSFEIFDSKLFAVNDSGRVVIWDFNLLDTIHFEKNDTTIHYTAICKDRQNQLFFGTDVGTIYKLNPSDLSFSFFMDAKYYIHSMCFNSDNKVFVVVPYAIYEPLSKRNWHKFTSFPAAGISYRKKVLGLFWKKTNQYFSLPEFEYLDKKGRWWMYKNYGEFGTAIQIFDTEEEKICTEKFDSIRLNHLSPKSIFEDNRGNTFITSGLQHFSMSGEIVKYDTNNVGSVIFDGLDIKIETDTTSKVEIDGEGIANVIATAQPLPDNDLFIGPGTYNNHDSCIYFASNKGIYKAYLPDEGKLQNPKLSFSPNLILEREALAIGYEMPIKQIGFTYDNRLLFLTSKNGFGLYDGKKLLMLQ